MRPWLGIVVLGALIAPRAGHAACERSLAALSEARAARWLVGDDLRTQSQLDVERQRLRVASRLGDNHQAFHLFGVAGAAYQRVFAMETCSSLGPRQGSLDRLRGVGSVGFTHEATGLHARVSFLHANDHLAVPGAGTGKNIEDATAGYRQNLLALRLGHEQWFQTLFGYVSSETPYTSPGTGVRIDPRLRGAPAPGYFFGGTIPALHTSMVTLLQRGRPEVVSLMASELRPGRLPFSIGLGPTYIREERQVVGVLRLRGYAYEKTTKIRPTMTEGRSKTLLEGHDYTSAGPVFELGVEGRNTRLRHGRLRYEINHSARAAAKGWSKRAAFDIGLRAEGTLFRSRFFTESFEPTPRGAKRGNAWGFNAGGGASIQLAFLAWSMEVSAGMNRPELLALIPSAAHRAELQMSGSLRLEY